MKLQWHGEGDAVQPEAFRPTDFRLELTYGDEKVQVLTTATPEIASDPQYMRWTIHKLIDSLVDALKDRGVM